MNDDNFDAIAVVIDAFVALCILGGLEIWGWNFAACFAPAAFLAFILVLLTV